MEREQSPYYRADQRREALMGFYVVASDRELTGKVMEILNKRGFVGVVDGGGRLNYLVDGRVNPYQAALRIAAMGSAMFAENVGTAPYVRNAWPHGETNPQTAENDDAYIKQACCQMMKKHGFNDALRGTMILELLLPFAVKENVLLSPLCKTLYPLAAQQYQISVQQVDRVIRYAAKSANIPLGNAQLINYLVRELREDLAHKKTGGLS